jgi:hypothetical protein
MKATPGSEAFRFDSHLHEYTACDTGEVLPHITGMLEAAGLIDDTWYTEESCERGQCVHSLTADYDLGALNPAGCVSCYRPYLLAHVGAMKVLRPKWRAVEEPMIHPVLRFGGRPDRVGLVTQLQAVLEVKSGAPDDSHCIQTALQAILASYKHPLPPASWARYALYLKDSGKYKLERHTRRQDFDKAYEIIRKLAA